MRIKRAATMKTSLIRKKTTSFQTMLLTSIQREIQISNTKMKGITNQNRKESKRIPKTLMTRN
jgi:hypothetical protein